MRGQKRFGALMRLFVSQQVTRDRVLLVHAEAGAASWFSAAVCSARVAAGLDSRRSPSVDIWPLLR